MNLQENYKRLFAGKVRSNDASILREAKYNIKQDTQYHKHSHINVNVGGHDAHTTNPYDIAKTCNLYKRIDKKATIHGPY